MGIKGMFVKDNEKLDQAVIGKISIMHRDGFETGEIARALKIPEKDVVKVLLTELRKKEQ